MRGSWPFAGGLALAAATVVCAAAPAPGRGEPQKVVLDRITQYVVDYEPKLSSVMAEEEYEQWTTGAIRLSPGRRVLRSDFVFARVSDEGPWVGFRDTFLVDGKPIRDHDARMAALLADRSEAAVERAAELVEEGTRFNLGDDIVHRTINAPTLTLDLLHPRFRDRFSFERAGYETVGGVALWKIAFVERAGPALIVTPAGDNQKTRGEALVDPSTGAVLRTALEVEISRDNKARVTIEFLREEKLGFLVPVEMRESYRRPSGEIKGRARYTGFRQFQTSGRVVADDQRGPTLKNRTTVRFSR
jgi:hypothetical protein